MITAQDKAGNKYELLLERQLIPRPISIRDPAFLGIQEYDPGMLEIHLSTGEPVKYFSPQKLIAYTAAGEVELVPDTVMEGWRFPFCGQDGRSLSESRGEP